MSVAEQKSFAREYLETRYKLANKTEAVTDELVERLYGQILLIKPVITRVLSLLNNIDISPIDQ